MTHIQDLLGSKTAAKNVVEMAGMSPKAFSKLYSSAMKWKPSTEVWNVGKGLKYVQFEKPPGNLAPFGGWIKDPITGWEREVTKFVPRFKQIPVTLGKAGGGSTLGKGVYSVIEWAGKPYKFPIIEKTLDISWSDAMTMYPGYQTFGEPTKVTTFGYKKVMYPEGSRYYTGAKTATITEGLGGSQTYSVEVFKLAPELRSKLYKPVRSPIKASFVDDKGYFQSMTVGTRTTHVPAMPGRYQSTEWMSIDDKTFSAYSTTPPLKNLPTSTGFRRFTSVGDNVIRLEKLLSSSKRKVLTPDYLDDSMLFEKLPGFTYKTGSKQFRVPAQWEPTPRYEGRYQSWYSEFLENPVKTSTSGPVIGYRQSSSVIDIDKLLRPDYSDLVETLPSGDGVLPKYDNTAMFKAAAKEVSKMPKGDSAVSMSPGQFNKWVSKVREGTGPYGSGVGPSGTIAPGILPPSPATSPLLSLAEPEPLITMGTTPVWKTMTRELTLTSSGAKTGALADTLTRSLLKVDTKTGTRTAVDTRTLSLTRTDLKLDTPAFPKLDTSPRIITDTSTKGVTKTAVPTATKVATKTATKTATKVITLAPLAPGLTMPSLEPWEEPPIIPWLYDEEDEPKKKKKKKKGDLKWPKYAPPPIPSPRPLLPLATVFEIEARTGREAYHPTGEQAYDIALQDIMRGEAFAGQRMVELIGWGKPKRRTKRKTRRKK
ncbi:MAG: hypothetical protein DRP08_03560 [Candidatus Aenigmatarchaeota archaeon]|nr:MAG: hypothetical protein DRP08_03560 [Candidatus Aenigmarchaeota archaeon]